MNVMRCKSVLVLMEVAKSRLSQSFGYIKFRPDMSVNEAEFKDSLGGEYGFNIGTKELMSSPDTDLPIGQAMVPLVNLFHEVCGHGGQLCREFNKSTPLSLSLALNYYACKSSTCYYGIDDDGDAHPRYFKHGHEIAAQYMAIKSAYSFLESTVGQAKAEYMMLSYVDYRVKLGSEFISSTSGVKCVDDVLDKFNRQYGVCVFDHHTYEPELSRTDYLHQFSRAVNLDRLPSFVASCHNGFKQDAMMASALFRVSSDYARYGLKQPVFESVDMRPAAVFRIFSREPPKPRKKELDLSALDTYDDLVVGNKTDDDEYGF